VDENVIDELLDALLSPLEAAEARSLALLQALMQARVLTEEQLAPFLKQAENASEIKARGLRIRLKRILSDVARDAERAKKKTEDDDNKNTGKADSKAGKTPEGPQQDPDEEAREHGKEPSRDEPKTGEQQAKQEPPSPPKKENAA
jgi:hypothetical protein